MKVAIIGAGRWYVSVYYLPALKDLDADIAAIADPAPQVLDKVGEGLDCRCYTNYRELLDKEEADLVFAHTPHSEMNAAVKSAQTGQPVRLDSREKE